MLVCLAGFFLFFMSSLSSSSPVVSRLDLSTVGDINGSLCWGCGGLCMWFSTDWDHCDHVFGLSLTMPSFSSPDSTLHLISLPLYSTHSQLVLWTAITNHWIKSDLIFFICACFVVFNFSYYLLYLVWCTGKSCFLCFCIGWCTVDVYSMHNIAF